MAELTATELETKIAAIDTQIDALVAAPDNMVDYRAGQKSFSNSQKISAFQKLREMYQKILDTYPAEDYQRWAISTSDKGEDESEYLGE